MSGTLHYRLVLRDPDDTIDEVTLSNLPADANPFLTAPPSGDGESLDPLTGAVGLAEYVVRVADLVGTLNTATVVMDEQWTYADITARNAVWIKTSDGAQPYSYLFPTAPSVTVNGDNGGFTGSAGDYGTGIEMHVGVAHAGLFPGFARHTRTVTGLTPGGVYTVVCDRVRLSRARAGFEDNLGMSVNGGEGVTNGLDGKVTIPTTADGSGQIVIALGHFDLENGTAPIAMTFDRIRIYGTGGTVSARVVTGLLADAAGRWTGVNRKASWYESTNSGTTWTLIFAGWLTQVTLTGGIDWALHLGDSDRRERHISAFTTLPTAAGFSGMRLIGTPFAPSQNVAAHYPAAWRFRVEKTGATDGDLPADAVLLRFVSGWAPEHLDDPIVFRTGSINADVATAISLAAQPYLQTTGGVSTFPSLRAVVTTPGGATVGSFVPYGTGGIYLLIGDGKTVGEGGVLFDVAGLYLALQWTGTLPSVGTQYDVIVAVGAISETTPFWWQGHPVDLVAGLLTEAGLAYDATSAATVKAALGALYAQYRFTKTEALWDLIERVAFGPCGFALRRNIAWEWEFFETRTIPSSEPSETIDENAMYAPERAIFDLGVDSQVTAVVWKLINWVIGNATSTDAPMDRAQAQAVTATYRGTLGDSGTYGEHQVVYDLPGTIILLDGQAPAPTANIYHQTQSEIILDRWGRGVPSSEIATLRASGIDAKLGEFVVVDLDHKPTIDTGATPSGVRGGARICQVTHRTRDPAGPILQLLDVGTATTNALVPAFTLAQGTDTRHASTLTLTNSGTLTGYQVEVQVNTGASEPSGGTSLPLFAPDAIAHDLPAQLAGSTVWARARTVKDDELPGAWSAWANVALDAVPPVTGLANSAGANDTERVLTWTVGDATLPVRVRWKATADATYLNNVTLPAGSNTYTITGVVPGTAMTAAVDHLELSPFTGDSADATTTWTAGSTTPTLTAPSNPQGFTDGAGTFGLRVTASVLPSRTVFMLALETGVGTGVYGTPVEVGNIASVAGASACVVTLTRANDGLRVQLTAHHAKTGYTDSSDTTAVTLDPWETTATPPGEASDAAYAIVGAVPASLPNGRQLVDGTGTLVNDATAGEVAIDLDPTTLATVSVTQATDLAPLWSGGLSESIELVGITTGRLALQYSVDSGSTWAFMDGTAGPYVSVETAGVQRGDWVTPEAGFTGASNDVLCRVVAVDASSTVTEINERLRFWKNPGAIQSARIGADFLVAGAFSTDPVLGNVVVEFNAAAVSAPAPPDPPGDGGASSGSDTLPISRGLLAWHIADAAANTYTSIGSGNFRVSTLADLSGNGNHLTDAGAAEGPTEPFRPDSSTIATLNSRQPVNYSGGNGYSVWPTGLFTGVTAAELFLVVKAAGGDPNSHFSGVDYSDGCWKLGPGGSGSARWARHDSGTADTGAIAEDFGSSTLRDLGDAPGSLAGFRIYNVRAATNQWVAALDGSVVITSGSNTPAFSTAPTIGQESKGCNIDICEIVLYSNVLTTDERALVLAALQSRWGL